MNWRDSWDLSTIPDAVFRSETSRRRSNLRKSFGGGRPKKLSDCPKCGAQLGAAEKRTHKCTGDAKQNQATGG